VSSIIHYTRYTYYYIGRYLAQIINKAQLNFWLLVLCSLYAVVQVILKSAYYDYKQNVGSIDFKIILCTFNDYFKFHKKKFHVTPLLPHICLKLITDLLKIFNFKSITKSLKKKI